MIWEGYCVDFAQRLSEKLDFDYVLVPAKTGSMGERIPGLNNTWDGLVHDLMTAVSYSFLLCLLGVFFFLEKYGSF